MGFAQHTFFSSYQELKNFLDPLFIVTLLSLDLYM